MAHVLKTAVVADIQDLIVRVPERLTGFLDAKGVNILRQGFAQGFFEEAAEVLGIHAGQICQFMKIDPVGVVVMDVA